MMKYDLEERTFKFARDVRFMIKQLPKNNTIVKEDGPQLLKASGSVGANYCEANDALSRKDFVYRMRVSRKEARESHYWLRLIDATVESNNETMRLIQEALELRKIFSAIINKAA
jgi:four helix bundle protein